MHYGNVDQSREPPAEQQTPPQQVPQANSNAVKSSDV